MTTEALEEGGGSGEGGLSPAVVKEIEDKLNGLDESHMNQINALHMHLLELEKELGRLQENVNTSGSAGGSAAGGNANCGPMGATGGLAEMFETIQKMQQELEELVANSSKFNEIQEKGKEDLDVSMKPTSHSRSQLKECAIYRKRVSTTGQRGAFSTHK